MDDRSNKEGGVGKRGPESKRSGSRKRINCSHLDQIRDVRPDSEGCSECLALGDSWVHLRMCLICGHVGCCNDSKNTHAQKHYNATGHPVMRSIEPGESWRWCYVDQTLMRPS